MIVKSRGGKREKETVKVVWKEKESDIVVSEKRELRKRQKAREREKKRDREISREL